MWNYQQGFSASEHDLVSPIQMVLTSPQTFQSEDAISQGIHNVIQCRFVRHIEEVFIVGVAGDVLDLRDERLWVLLPADVMTENLEPGVGETQSGLSPGGIRVKQ